MEETIGWNVNLSVLNLSLCVLGVPYILAGLDPQTTNYVLKLVFSTYSRIRSQLQKLWRIIHNLVHTRHIINSIYYNDLVSLVRFCFF